MFTSSIEYAVYTVYFYEVIILCYEVISENFGAEEHQDEMRKYIGKIKPKFKWNYWNI